MFTDKINLDKLKGTLTIKIGDKIVYDDHNAIVANAKNILANLIKGDISYMLDTIKIFNGVTLLASRTTVNSLLTPTKARFLATYSTDIFSGNFNKIELHSNAGGKFSEVLGLNITKTNLQEMSIDWRIEII